MVLAVSPCLVSLFFSAFAQVAISASASSSSATMSLMSVMKFPLDSRS